MLPDCIVRNVAPFDEIVQELQRDACHQRLPHRLLLRTALNEGNGMNVMQMRDLLHDDFAD